MHFKFCLAKVQPHCHSLTRCNSNFLEHVPERSIWIRWCCNLYWLLKAFFYHLQGMGNHHILITIILHCCCCCL
uniref:Uncharacterized protein n=1 Tax=Arundo donax TaxID=35708 RepID=A0A0A9HCX2_ARUDO